MKSIRPIGSPVNSTRKSNRLISGTVFARVLIWIMWTLALATIPAAAGSRVNPSALSPAIVIDPGHGGRDVGAKGPTGVTEKTVALDLARQLASKLEPRFKVFFTRSDDYAVDLFQRAATANQSKADMLISIHTGSGFLHRTEGIGIYYYAPLKTSAVDQVPSGQSAEAQQWDLAHRRHRAASKALGNSIKASLAQVDGIDMPTIQGVPLKLLEGVDLPAVVVEIGYISHPATEMQLSTPEGIERLSAALAQGIRHFAQGDAAVDAPSQSAHSKP